MKEKESKYNERTILCTVFVFLSWFMAMICSYIEDIPWAVINIIAFFLWSYLLYFVYPPKA